jgi:hypothetical protein
MKHLSETIEQEVGKIAGESMNLQALTSETNFDIEDDNEFRKALVGGKSLERWVQKAEHARNGNPNGASR